MLLPRHITWQPVLWGTLIAVTPKGYIFMLQWTAVLKNNVMEGHRGRHWQWIVAPLGALNCLHHHLHLLKKRNYIHRELVYKLNLMVHPCWFECSPINCICIMRFTMSNACQTQRVQKCLHWRPVRWWVKRAQNFFGIATSKMDLQNIF